MDVEDGSAALLSEDVPPPDCPPDPSGVIGRVWVCTPDASWAVFAAEPGAPWTRYARSTGQPAPYP